MFQNIEFSSLPWDSYAMPELNRSREETQTIREQLFHVLQASFQKPSWRYSYEIQSHFNNIKQERTEFEWL